MSSRRFPEVPLGSICEINPKLAKESRPADTDLVSFVPMVAVDEVSAAIAGPSVRPYAEVKKGFTPFRDGDVLFAKITPCMENGKLALARDLRGGVGFGSTEFHVLRASSRVLPEWLRYYVMRPSFRAAAKRRMTGAVGQQRVPAEFLSKALIPLPSTNEQRRIVELLLRAEAIVRLRQEAEAKAKEIVPAVFLDMFGDPEANPRDWPRKPLGEVLGRIDSGKSPTCDDGPRKGHEWGVLKLGAVTWGEYDESAHKVLPASVEPFSDAEVRPGDVLLVRKNTAELVGASAFVWRTDGRMLLPDLVFRLVLRSSDEMDPIYLWQLLSTESKRAKLRGLASGAAASMPNISKARLAGLPVEVPAIHLQRAFAARVTETTSICESQARSLKTAEAVFQSLLSSAFGAVS